MKVEFVTSVAVITPDPPKSRQLYMDAFGLPLKQLDGDYFASEEIGGCNHFGGLAVGAGRRGMLGTRQWPDDLAVPQLSMEFEVADAEAVTAAAEELTSRGFELLHGAKREPWGQIVARLLSPEGAVVGVSYMASLHETKM